MERSTSSGSRSFFNTNNNSNDARAIWSSETSTGVDWYNSLSDSFINQATTMATTPTFQGGEDAVHSLIVNAHAHSSPFASPLYSKRGGGLVGGSQYPDPHLMCLKLGKRHYFGDAATPLGDRQGAAVGFSINDNAGNCVTTIHGGSKRGKPYYELVGVGVGGGASSLSPSSGVTVAASAVPRCQVDGCHAVLLNAKDYHRRHKVCEMHSKTPKVRVLGLEQRFCQQCSRFHAVAEFDESKRSCRRRLAGHNERRRKSSQDQSATKNQSQQVNRKLSTSGGRHPHFPMSNGCALSLLSSKNDSWISSGDLPARCSAALGELIAENRAAVLARQLILDKDWQWHHYDHHPTEDHPNGHQNEWNFLINYQQQMGVKTDGIVSGSWDRISDAGGGHVTLELMQAPNSAFGFLSVERNSKEDGECMP